MIEASDLRANGTRQTGQKASSDELSRLREILGEEPDPDALAAAKTDLRETITDVIGQLDRGELPDVQRELDVLPPDAPAQRSHEPIMREVWRQLDAVEPANVGRGAMLPAIHRAKPDEAERMRLLEFNDEPVVGDQLMIPGVGGRNGEACPAWMLGLFDATGGRALADSGKGVSWDLCLFVGALLHLPHFERNGHERRLILPARDVIRWRHPGGWKHRSRDWRKFTDALHRVHNLRVPIPGGDRVALIYVERLPASPSGRVSFRFMIPTGAASGARVHWPTLCQYGTESARLYRAYLSACAVLDHTATNGEPLRAGSGALARLVPSFTAEELGRMAGFMVGHRKSRQRGLEAFQRIEADGHIELRPDGARWKIIGPRDLVASMNVRASLPPRKL